jgi:hypothetical protein
MRAQKLYDVTSSVYDAETRVCDEKDHLLKDCLPTHLREHPPPEMAGVAGSQDLFKENRRDLRLQTTASGFQSSVLPH